MATGEWRRITLSNVRRIYRRRRVLERQIVLRDFSGELSHEKPDLPITNQMKTLAQILVDSYSGCAVFENAIAVAIDFFHIDALSPAVLLKVQLGLQTTLMARALYRNLAERRGNGMENAKVLTVFRRIVNANNY